MIYFETPGKHNTAVVVNAAETAAKRGDIGKIVVATTTGATAKEFLYSEREIIAVTHQCGYNSRGSQELTDTTRARLEQNDVKILTTTHFFAGVDRAINRQFGGVYPAELMAHTLRILGQGFKVCVEIATMAMDAGFIDADEDVIAVGGTGRGADTAIILRPAHSQNFFETDVKEILCMPRGHRRELR